MMQSNGFRRRAIHVVVGCLSPRAGRMTVVSCLLLSGPITSALVGFSFSASAQNVPITQRIIRGKVYDTGDTPQNGAVVYLKNMKSLEIKTYIAQDATYRFGQLGSTEDYQLWAEFGGHKSKVKNISGFDSKKLFDVSLHIEDK